MLTFVNIFREIRLSDGIDIFLMSILIYSVFVWFKKSKAAFVLIGIFLVGIVYLLARQFNLVLTSTILQGFFAVILVAVIVIFQEEIRHLFEKIAVWSLNRGPRRQKLNQFSHREVEILVRTLTDLAQDHIGALIVLKGRDIISRHLQGGTDLNGEISEPILKSLFDPHSDGHDGAVIIDGTVVTQFGIHLPLSKDLKKIQRTGTRHAAALGLAELTDALCLAVSEEQGTISVAQNGEIEIVTDPERLKNIIQHFYNENFPFHARSLSEHLTTNFREKVLAILLTLILWFVLVYENKLAYKTYMVPLEYTNLPMSLTINDIAPKTIDLTFSGRRSTFYFIKTRDIRIVLNLAEETAGVTFKDIHRSNIAHPDSIMLENILSPRVRLMIGDKASPAPTLAPVKKPRSKHARV